MSWYYIFAKNEEYPDPLAEIRALAEREEAGETPFLKLSDRDDAPLKGADEGEIVYLCTREHGRWSMHGQAVVVGLPQRGEVPGSVAAIYGPTGDRHWWRRLEGIQLYPEPKEASDLGLAEGSLPSSGRAHVVHVPATSNGAGQRPAPTSDPLARLTEVMDAAWDEGRLTPNAIDEAVRDFRKSHPYGR